MTQQQLQPSEKEMPILRQLTSKAELTGADETIRTEQQQSQEVQRVICVRNFSNIRDPSSLQETELPQTKDMELAHAKTHQQLKELVSFGWLCIIHIASVL